MDTDEGIIGGFHANTEKGHERKGYISMFNWIICDGMAIWCK